MACSTWYSAAVTRSGRLYTWGSPSSLCLGTDAGHLRWVPQPVRGPFQRQRVRKVSCGPFHCAAVTRSGALYTWGDGYSGRLGHGNQETCLTPRLVDYLAACTVMDVSCGHFHTGERAGEGLQGRPVSSMGGWFNWPRPMMVVMTDGCRGVAAATVTHPGVERVQIMTLVALRSCHSPPHSGRGSPGQRPGPRGGSLWGHAGPPGRGLSRGGGGAAGRQR